jgi:hypothetical protein
MFSEPELWSDPKNLLPEDGKTVRDLKRLGRTMCEADGTPPARSSIPSLYTYFGQFLDHEITFVRESNEIPKLHACDLAPLSPEFIRAKLSNQRTPKLDLDCIYGQSPEENERMRDGKRMRLGKVIPVGQRPPGKVGDDYDLHRDGGVALIGDPRNDENLIVSQLHVAFLRAHNVLVDERGYCYDDASKALRQHFQWVVLHDFLKTRVADRGIVNQLLESGQNRFYRPSADKLYMPLEFSAAVYRFGHCMVRDTYRLNSLFGQIPFVELFTQTAFKRQKSRALPESWIIDWGGFIDGGENQARRIGVKLTNHLASLPDGNANPSQDQKCPPSADAAMLSVRDLLRGYLLRIPTGQAVAERLGLPVMSVEQIEAAAGPAQAEILRETGLSTRTPLWYYILIEAVGRQILGPVGSAIVAEVLIELIRQSKDTILSQTPKWKPWLGRTKGQFTLPDLLKLGGVLSEETRLPEENSTPQPPPFGWPGPSEVAPQ